MKISVEAMFKAPMRRLVVAMLLGVAALAAVASAQETPESPALAEKAQAYCTDQPTLVTAAFCAMGVRTVTFIGPEDREVSIEVLVADNEFTRPAGYQFIHPDVIRETAILFVYQRATSNGFHMCNVAAPLDIVWIRANGTLLDALVMSPGGARNPLFCNATYAPRRFGTYLYALELPAGRLAELGIEPISEWRFDVASWEASP